MRRPSTPLAVLFAVGLAVAGCGTDGTDDDGADPAQEASGDGAAVATTTMLGDVVADIVECAGGTSETLMPVGVDPHDFSASSDQVASMVSAQLVVANGLGLEEGLESALEGAEADGAVVVEVAPLVDPIEFGGGHSHEEDEEHSETDDHSDEEDADEDHSDKEDHSDEEHAHDNGSLDPHFWHDVGRMAEAAELIGADLADRTGDDTYGACGTEVHDELVEVDTEVRDILAAVPADQRVLITDHDALGYFADAYDFEVAGVVIPGGATLAEPSSQELSELVETIKTEAVPVVFSNNANPTDLVPAVAAEVGDDIDVVELYIGSLGPEGSGAETYVGMVTTNAERIAAALG